MDVILAVSKLNEGSGLLPNTLAGWCGLGILCIFAVILMAWASK